MVTLSFQANQEATPEKNIARYIFAFQESLAWERGYHASASPRKLPDPQAPLLRPGDEASEPGAR